MLQFSAYAKINLTLDVLSRREDGYHDVKMIMQRIGLHDDISLFLGTGVEDTCTTDRAELPRDGGNLALIAARAFERAHGTKLGGVDIKITKRIPSQAGLGGGSADAAAVLTALNEAEDAPFSTERLMEIGAMIGSDVPFCILGGTALAEGRGEQLSSLPSMPPCHLLLLVPEFSCSTRELYEKIDTGMTGTRPDTQEMLAALRGNSLPRVADALSNVFETLLAEEQTEISALRAELLHWGALGACLTGTGSVIYGIFDAAETANAAKAHFETAGYGTILSQPV